MNVPECHDFYDSYNTCLRQKKTEWVSPNFKGKMILNMFFVQIFKTHKEHKPNILIHKKSIFYWKIINQPFELII